MYRHFFKRLIDIVLSGMALLILAVPMAIIAIVVKFVGVNWINKLMPQHVHRDPCQYAHPPAE